MSFIQVVPFQLIPFAPLQMALLEEVTQRLQVVKQKTDAVVESVTASQGSLSETAAQTKSVLTQIRNQAVENPTANRVSEFTSSATEKLFETTTATLNSVTDATGKASTSLEDTFQKVGNLNNSIQEATQAAIRSLMNDWLSEHPIMGWLFHHPVMTLVLILVSLLLLFGLFQAIFRVIEQFWVTLFKSPLLLGKTLLGFRAVNSVEPVHSSGIVSTSGSEQVSQLLARLDQIQQEQKKILQELAALRENKKLP